MHLPVLRTVLAFVLVVLLGAPSGAHAASSVVGSPAADTVSAPVISSHPQGTTVAEGRAAVFEVAATGHGMTVRWQRSDDGVTWVDEEPAGLGPGWRHTTKSLRRVHDGRLYRAVVSNEAAPTGVASAAAAVRVTEPVLTETVDPADRTVTEGEPVTFTTAYVGPEVGLSPLWQVSRDGGETWELEGTSGLELILDAVASAMDGWQFRVRFESTIGVWWSAPATLAVLLAPPVITEHPRDLVVGIGRSGTFEVAVRGSDVRVRWQRLYPGEVWTELATVEGRTLEVRDLSSAMDGTRYRAVVSNAAGSVVSEEAVLRVAGGLQITEQPQRATVSEGQQASFTVAAAPYLAFEGTMTVRWQQSDDGQTWVDAPGESARSWTYTTPALTLAQNGRLFRALVSNEATAGLASNPAPVQVAAAPPVVVTHPEDRTATEGEAVTFAAGYGGTDGEVLARWQVSRDGGQSWALAGTTGLELTLDPVTLAMDGWQYRLRLENGAGTRWTQPATLRVLVAAPVITQHPEDQVVAAGGTATFTATYDGTESAVLARWQVSRDGGETWTLHGAEGLELTVVDVAPDMDGWQYRLRLDNDAGARWTAAATLTVRPAGGIRPLTSVVRPRVQLVDALPQGG